MEAYKQSVHGRAIQQGNLNAASCNDCHGVHDILPASDPHSKIWKQNVASTCAQCHKDVFDVYRQSIHGQAVAAGVMDAATCTDCHGEHRILAPGNPRIHGFSGQCFAGHLLALPCRHPVDGALQRAGARACPPIEDSYHGLASRSGQQTVANCASCHGVHNIFPSSDPRSTVNKANLGKTCGKCHPDAGQRFTIGSVHTLPTTTAGGRVLGFVKAFYLLAIPMILGSMMLHNFLDWWRKARRILAQYRVGHGQVRLTLNERVQHVLLLVSFITLVVTGFALKYPHSFWAEPIVQWEKNFPLRGWLHRIAGVVLIGGFDLPPDLPVHQTRWPALGEGHASQGARRAGGRANRGLQPGLSPQAAALCALQLHGEGGILGAGVGHHRHGRHRHSAVGARLGAWPTCPTPCRSST